MKRSVTPLSLSAALLATAMLLAVDAPLAGQPFRAAKKARLKLVTDRTAYEPGSTVRIAGLVSIEDHWHVNSNTPTYDYLIPTELSYELPAGFGEPRLQYPPHKLQQFAFTDEPIAVYDGRVTILAEFELPAGTAAGTVPIRASLRYQACDDKQCLPPVRAEASLDLEVGPGGVAANERIFAPSAAAQPAAGAAGRSPNLLWMLLLAMVGGFILNAMPCVLPVLSLKFFGLVKSAGQGRSHLVIGSLATAGGILVSFWALAVIAVAARGAGAAVGWGIQFQQPGFVTFLTVVVVLFSLNMWGLFEIPLPQRLAQVTGSGPREGLVGHFLSGLFATLMATPCSAPFLGTAIGFALAQEAIFIFAIFTAVGLGLALPYLLLAAFPSTARLLPKPGEWMVTFRGIMGFLLAGAAVWLFYVLAAQITSERLAFIQLVILTLALATWLWQRTRERSAARRLTAVAIGVSAIGAIVLAVGAPAVSGQLAKSSYHDWLAFDEAQARSLAAEGRLVFIDATADWCLTCKTNERLIIETTAIAEAFAKYQVVTMKADWTNRDDRITAFLAHYGKSAVPFYVLYRPGREPYVFGELLTKGQILDALAESVK